MWRVDTHFTLFEYTQGPDKVLVYSPHILNYFNYRQIIQNKH